MLDFIRITHAKLFQWYKGSITALPKLLYFQELFTAKCKHIETYFLP